MLIHKYKIPISDATEVCLELPKHSRVLCVQKHLARGDAFEHPHIWVAFDAKNANTLEERWFFIVLTGQEAFFLPSRSRYIGTVQLDLHPNPVTYLPTFVMHLFEEVVEGELA